MGEVQHDSETPAHGQQVITACAFIYHVFDGVTKVFLPKRAKTKKFLPDVFELVGGHIDFGEDLEVGLKREIREELNKEVELEDPFAAFTYLNEVKGSHSVEIIFLAQFIGGIDDIQTNPEDHSGYEWLSEQEVTERRSEIVPESQVQYSGEDDPEYLSILKGFKILSKKVN
ncbi:NUDIX hydrolase [Candidatus Saccharibacteria bacterium]|nr:NUDIX hydrolase [Candidatus Saccharibacteria bacterium]